MGSFMVLIFCGIVIQNVKCVMLSDLLAPIRGILGFPDSDFTPIRPVKPIYQPVYPVQNPYYYPNQYPEVYPYGAAYH